MSLRITPLRATTAELQTLYPWHFGGSIPTTGPIIGVDRMAGATPFGLDPFGLMTAGVAQNPNVVIAGAPANGKSALTKALLWNLVGAFGYRFVVTDVKNEYRQLAAALEVPVLALHPGGHTCVNPLDDADGRLEFVRALCSLCVDRSLTPAENAALAAAVRYLPAAPLLADVMGVLRATPAGMCDELLMTADQAQLETRDLRFGLSELLSGSLAGMFNGRSNVDLRGATRGFVVDVSKCGADDRVLRFAQLAGSRAVDQMMSSATGRTLQIGDEAWRLTGTTESVRWLQHSFKLGRNVAMSNVIVVHRLAEIGDQADGVVGKIASQLVSDSDVHILFRQGDTTDAADTVERLGLPSSLRDALCELPAHRCLIHVRGHLALVDVMLSRRMAALADTNAAMRQPLLAAVDA